MTHIILRTATFGDSRAIPMSSARRTISRLVRGSSDVDVDKWNAECNEAFDDYYQKRVNGDDRDNPSPTLSRTGTFTWLHKELEDVWVVRYEPSKSVITWMNNHDIRYRARVLKERFTKQVNNLKKHLVTLGPADGPNSYPNHIALFCEIDRERLRAVVDFVRAAPRKIYPVTSSGITAIQNDLAYIAHWEPFFTSKIIGVLGPKLSGAELQAIASDYICSSPADYEQAIKWLRFAKRAGSLAARFEFGRIYENGCDTLYISAMPMKALKYYAQALGRCLKKPAIYGACKRAESHFEHLFDQLLGKVTAEFEKERARSFVINSDWDEHIAQQNSYCDIERELTTLRDLSEPASYQDAIASSLLGDITRYRAHYSSDGGYEQTIPQIRIAQDHYRRALRCSSFAGTWRGMRAERKIRSIQRKIDLIRETKFKDVLLAPEMIKILLEPSHRERIEKLRQYMRETGHIPVGENFMLSIAREHSKDGDGLTYYTRHVQVHNGNHRFLALALEYPGATLDCIVNSVDLHYKKHVCRAYWFNIATRFTYMPYNLTCEVNDHGREITVKVYNATGPVYVRDPAIFRDDSFGQPISAAIAAW